MFVVCHAGRSGRVAMCAVPVQRAANLNRTIQVNNEIVPNTGKAAFFVPFVNVGGAYILPGPGRRTMNNDCVNFVHRLFHLGPYIHNGCNVLSNAYHSPRQPDKRCSGPSICVYRNVIA